MNRPTCGTCPLFAPVQGDAGECLWNPPDHILVPAPKATVIPGRPGDLMVQAISPPVHRQRPSCSNHSRMKAYMEWYDGQIGEDIAAGNPKEREIHRDSDGGQDDGGRSDEKNGQRPEKSMILRP